MKEAFRYNRRQDGAGGTARGYVRWLALCFRTLVRMCLRRPCSGRFVWAEDEAAEVLAAGFPALLAVPEWLFSGTAVLFPERFRLSVACSEDELLELLRRAEDRFGLRFDWDAFLAACERRNRRSRRLRALSDALARRAGPCLDTRSPSAALRDLLGKEKPI